MSQQTDFARIARAWLAEGPNQLADSVLDNALDEIHVTPQRRTSGLLRRLQTMNMPLKAIAAAAVVIVAVGGGILLLGGTNRGGTVGGPAGSAVPSADTLISAPPSATAGGSPCVLPVIVDSPLASGGCSFTSSVYRPHILIAGDSVWRPTVEATRYLALTASLPGAEGNSEGLGLTTLDRLTSKPCQTTGQLTDASTTAFKASAPGKGPAEFFAWLKAKTPLTFKAPTAIKIAGIDGLSSVVTLADGSLPACGGAVYYTATDSTVGNGAMGFASGWTWTIAAIDVNGVTVTVETWAHPARFDVFEPEAQKILAGLRFG